MRRAAPTAPIGISAGKKRANPPKTEPEAGLNVARFFLSNDRRGPDRARGGFVGIRFFDAPPQDIKSASISKCRLPALVTVIVTVCVFASFEV